MIKRVLREIGNRYIRRRTLQEFRRQRFVRVNERPIEYGYLFSRLTELQPVSVLDVGTGTSALPSLLATCGFQVTAIDNVTDYWPAGLLNRSFHVLDDDIRDPRLDGPFDVVACISTLEHIKEHEAAVAGMLQLTRPGGHVVITAPYHESRYHPNVYDAPEALYGKGLPYVSQSFSRAELHGWLDGDIPGEVVDQEYWRCFTGELWTFGELVRPPEKAAGPDHPHQLTCLTIRRQD